MRAPFAKVLAVTAFLLPLTASGSTERFRAPQHTRDPPLIGAAGPDELTAAANAGLEMEYDRAPQWALAEHRRLGRALDSLLPQRKGLVDAYVISIALDSDPVFGREAREAGKVLARRYDAAGRTIVLAGTDGSTDGTLPRGSPGNLATVLARVAEVMDHKEDALVLYTTSHGAQWGIAYNDADNGFGAVSPYRLWRLLNDLKLENRLLILSACYSGVFVPLLSTPTTAIVSAAASDRSSFGCVAENDWTFFGDAFINHALRKPQPIAAAVQEAKAMIGGWERQGGLQPSNPQSSMGANVGRWLTPLETGIPAAVTEPVGRPSVESLEAVRGR